MLDDGCQNPGAIGVKMTLGKILEGNIKIMKRI